MAQASTHAGPLHDLTGFQRDLLVTTATLATPSGLDIKAALETAYEEQINHGRLYPNLDDLVDKGLVEKGTKDQRTNEYVLTGRGRRELRSHLSWADQALDTEADA